MRNMNVRWRHKSGRIRTMTAKRMAGHSWFIPKLKPSLTDLITAPLLENLSTLLGDLTFSSVGTEIDRNAWNPQSLCPADYKCKCFGRQIEVAEKLSLFFLLCKSRRDFGKFMLNNQDVHFFNLAFMQIWEEYRKPFLRSSRIKKLLDNILISVFHVRLALNSIRKNFCILNKMCIQKSKT